MPIVRTNNSQNKSAFFFLISGDDIIPKHRWRIKKNVNQVFDLEKITVGDAVCATSEKRGNPGMFIQDLFRIKNILQ
jgi:hypothetical protein